MSVIRLHQTLLATFCALIALDAAAFKINPLDRKYSASDTPFLAAISDSVHEEQVDAAMELLSGAMGGDANGGCPTASLGAVQRSPARKYDPVIRGVWWPDDPNQKLYGVSYGTWLAWMNDGNSIAKTGRNWQGVPARITSRYLLNYRSHFGDLQQLHSMANEPGVQAAVTQNLIIEWAEFLYRIAVCETAPASEIGLAEPREVSGLFPLHAKRSVHQLFAPSYTLGGDSIPLVVTGVLLHLIQDSFSTSHVRRESSPSAKCPAGRVIQFYAFQHQDSSEHGAADKREAWLGGNPQKAMSNPVVHSAKVLHFIREKADWQQVVRPYFSETLFCLDHDSVESGPSKPANSHE